MTRTVKKKLARTVAGALLSGFTLLVAGAAWAQDADPEQGRSIWRQGASCRECHGWAGHGVQDVPQQPQGADLRSTTLTKEQMAETIKCGRPGTEMPYFGNNVWTENNKCYGMTRAEAGQMMSNRGDSTLNQRQIDNLVAFIFANFVGKGPPTFEECQATFGANSPRCGEYPKAGAAR